MKQFVLASVCLAVTLFWCRLPASGQCTGLTNTTTTGANAGIGGTTSWQNPNSVQSVDGSYAAVDAVVSFSSIITTTTDYLNVTNLGLSVPAGNTICGVVVTINRRTFSVLALGASTTSDNSILLIKGGARVGTEHAATAVNWPTAAATATYGGAGDLWGTTLLPSDVNASNFGVAISAKLVAQILSVAFSAQIDQVTVTVYSSPPIILPITIQDFTARNSAGGNVLSWRASVEVEGDAGRWAVERSAGGDHWSQLDVLAAGAGRQDYTYTDASPLQGTSFYRLNLQNTDGSLAYSAVMSVAAVTPINTRCYPNPFTDMINIVSLHSFGKLSLKNFQGQTLWVGEYGDGVRSAHIPASGLPAGLYFVQVDGAATYKLIKN